MAAQKCCPPGTHRQSCRSTARHHYHSVQHLPLMTNKCCKVSKQHPKCCQASCRCKAAGAHQRHCSASSAAIGVPQQLRSQALQDCQAKSKGALGLCSTKHKRCPPKMLQNQQRQSAWHWQHRVQCTLGTAGETGARQQHTCHLQCLQSQALSRLLCWAQLPHCCWAPSWLPGWLQKIAGGP